MSSNTIDERVAKITFDNKKFEKNVKKSMSTIDKLKSKMNFKNVTNGLNDNFGTVDTSPLENAVSKVSLKMSMFQHLSFNFLDQLSKKIIYVGEKLVKNLSIDNIAAGWQKFSDKTTSVSTLMAQDIKIGDSLVDSELKLETVTAQLEKLNFFTDETSYNFIDMVSNIGKFTAAGQSLDEAMEAMMGIATWAALSGQNATVASNAMYQLSQAMSVGVVRKEDYKSIQNANMDTREFKQQALDAAEAAGYLIQQIDGTYQTTSKAAKAGITVDLDNFASTLTEGGWLTSEVLMQTLQNYSSAFDEIYGMVNGYTDAEGIFHEGEYETASEAIEAYKKQLEELKVQIEECTDAEEKERLQTEYDTKMFGIKAFEAAQQARTFSDAINSIKDAVSTSWMNTFEQIFGNQQEAVKLWTKLSNKLWDIFASGGENRVNLFSAWHEAGGRDALFGDEGALWNILDAIESIISAVKEAFNNVFPITTESLLSFSNGLKNVTKALKPSENQLKVFVKILTGLLKVVRNIVKFIKSVLKGLDPLFRVIKGSIESIFKGVKKIFDKFENFRSSKVSNQIGEEADFFVKVTKTISNTLENFIDFLSPYVKKLKKIINEIIDSIDFKQIEKIIDFLEPIFSTIWKLLTGVVKKVLDFLLDIPDQLKKFVNAIENSGFVKFIKTTWNSIVNLFSKSTNDITKTTKTIKSKSKELANVVEETGNVIVSKTNSFVEKLEAALEPFKPLINSLKSIFEGLLSILQAFVPIISTLFTYLGQALKTIGDSLNEFFSRDPDVSIFDKIKKFIEQNFVGIITAAISVLVLKNVSRLIYFFRSMLKTLTFGLFEVLDSFSGLLDKYAFKVIASGIKDIAISIGIICLSLIALTTVNTTKLLKVLGVISTLLVVIGGISIALIKMVKVGKTITNSVKQFTTVKDGIFTTINNLFNSEGFGKALQIKAIGYTIKQIAESIAILAATMAALTLLDVNKVDDALKRVIILMGTFTLMAKLLSSSSKGGRTTKVKGIASMGIVLFLLATQLKKISEISEKDLNRAIRVIISIGSVLTAMMVINNLTKKMPKAETGKSITAKLALNINSEALGLAALALTLIQIAKIPEGNLWTAVGVIASITGIVIVLTLAIAFINKFLNSSKKVIKKNKDGSSEITQNIINSVKDIKKIISAMIALVGAAVLLTQIAKNDTNSLKAAIEAITVIGMVVALVIGAQAIANNSKSEKNNSKVNDIISSALALAILASSVAALAFIPINNLIRGEIALGVLVGMVVALGVVNKYLFESKDKKVKSMILLASSLVILTAAVAALAFIPINNLIRGEIALIVLGGILTGLAFVNKYLFESKSHNVKSILTLVKALAALAATAMILGFIPIKNLVKGSATLIALSSILVILGTVNKFFFQTRGNNVKPMLKLIASLVVLATSTIALGFFPASNLVKGSATLIALSSIIIILGVVNKYLFESKGNNVKSMLVLIGSLISLAASAVTLGYFPTSNLIKGGVTLIALSSIVLILGIINKFLFKAKSNDIKPMIMLVVALVALAGTAVALGYIPTNNLIKGGIVLGALSAIILVLALINKFLFKPKEDGASLTALVLSLTALGLAIAVLGFMPLQNAINGLLIMASAIAIIGVISKLIGNIDPKAIAAIGIIATSMLVLGAALKMLSSVSWEVLGIAIVSIVSMLGIVLLFAYTLTPIVGSLLAITSALLMISASILMLGVASALLAKFIQPLTQAIKEALPDIMNNIKTFFDLLPDVLLAGLRALCQTLVDSIPIVGEFILNFLLGLVEFVKTDLGPIIDAIFDLILNTFVALGKAFRDNMPKVIDALFDVGKYLMQGLWNGICQFLINILKGIPFIGKEIEKFLKSTLQINSPSRMTYEMGKYLDQGLANGIRDNVDYVTDETKDFGNKVGNNMSSAISKVAEILNNGIPEDALTIRPVMDLSEIQNGTNTLFGMMKSIDGYTITGTADSVAENIARTINRSKNTTSQDNNSNANTDSQTENGNLVINNTFNITGENPNEIADKVSEIMQLQIDRRKAAWAK